MSARKPADAGLFRFVSYSEAAAMFDLSDDAIKLLAAQKDFPVFSRKICPRLMMDWLEKNARDLRELKVG